jgi:ankyrin repeat protein
VVCQLDTLRKCLKTNSLREALRSLPKTLDETYSRILCNIEEEYSKDAFKILEWLVYSARPLDIQELAEVVAVDIDDDPRFEPENRLGDPLDILTICSSLVTTTRSTFLLDDGDINKTEEIRLAHFSVKEYLISDRIQKGGASRYAIQNDDEEHLAQTCLTYLVHFTGPAIVTPSSVDEFPLAGYAAMYWIQHTRAAQRDIDKTTQLILRLFQSSDAYINWIRLCDFDSFQRRFSSERSKTVPNMSSSLEDVASPLYYAALMGLVEPARQLLDRGANVNAQEGGYGNALQAACERGQMAIVKLLLDHGADVNAESRGYIRQGDTALQSASFWGYDAIVKLLLESGADVNAQGGQLHTALHAASLAGNEAVVRLLLNHGADVNAKGGIYHTALQAAAMENSDVATIRLEEEADIIAQGGMKYLNKHEEVVRLLLEHGADINARIGPLHTVLKEASLKGKEATVRILHEHGADINT